MTDEKRKADVRKKKWRRLLAAGLAVIFIIPLAILLQKRLDWLKPKIVRLKAPNLNAGPATIAPGIHLLGGLFPAAAYVVETETGLVLIDAGLEPDAGHLKRQMTMLNLDWKSIDVILLTHVHGDHTGGAQKLRELTGAKVYCGHADAEILKAGGPREAFFSTFYMPEASPQPTTVDVKLKGNEVIDIGDIRFVALASPGHTPGGTCYLMKRGNLRVLFSGDVIMRLSGNELSNSHLDKPLGTYSTYLAPRYLGNAKSYLATLRKLRAIRAPDLVLPGHPRMDLTPQNPVISQSRWESILDSGIREMKQLVGRYEKDGANFLDGTPRELLPGLYYLGDKNGIGVYGLRSSSKFFLINAPGGPGLSEFVDSSLSKLNIKPEAPAAVLLTSCDSNETSGLFDLVKRTQAKVVAPPAGLEMIKKACPKGTEVISAKDLPARNWFEVRTLPLHGRGIAPIAYLVSWAGKSVLFTARIPVKINEARAKEIAADFNTARAGVSGYRASLTQLKKLDPDLWLPATPTEGQNANLYDHDWQQTIADNWNWLSGAMNRGLK